MIATVGRRPDLSERVKLMFERKIGPDEMVPMSTILGIVGAALLGGRFHVAASFMRTGKRLGEEARELATRKDMLATARTQLSRAQPRAKPGLARSRAEQLSTST